MGEVEEYIQKIKAENKDNMEDEEEEEGDQEND